MEYCPSFRDSLYHGAIVDPSWRDSLYHGDFYDDDWYDDALYHHGVKGMKWGVRRYQNYDGTYKNKAAVGSIARVRQKQKMFKSKINSDGVLGKGDTNFIRRTTVNDWRRGRINQLEAKAQNREAIRAFKKNRTKSNAKRVGITAAKRVGLNALVDPTTSGRYSRWRDAGNGRVTSTAYALAPAVPGAAVGMGVGEAVVDHVRNHPINKNARENRKAYAKKTRQTSRL